MRSAGHLKLGGGFKHFYFYFYFYFKVLAQSPYQRGPGAGKRSECLGHSVRHGFANMGLQR